MLGGATIRNLADVLRASSGVAAKRDIGTVATHLSLSTDSVVPIGDDCAAIPDGRSYLLLAIEGFMNEFVGRDPWFAGWCGVMVNLSDVAAMGGRAIAVVDAFWSDGHDGAEPILNGLRTAANIYGVPIVGGHTNMRTDRNQLAVAILGRAHRLLTSFDARAGDRLIAAIDLRGRYREPFLNWEAATNAPADRLRADLELLPTIAENGLSAAAKDISQGGLVGTTMMFAECSQVGAMIDVGRVPRPEAVAIDRWLLTFPSYGYLLAVHQANVATVLSLFADRGIAAAEIGGFTADPCVRVSDGGNEETIWDFTREPLICGLPAETSA